MTKRFFSGSKPDRRQKKRDGIVEARGSGRRSDDNDDVHRPRRNSSRREDLSTVNSHINFSREGKKSSARKDLTDVVCIKCGVEFELPFKPRHPDVYCNSCFKKKGSKKKELQKPFRK